MRLLAFIVGAVLVGALAPVRGDLLVKPNDVVLVATEAPMMPGMLSVDIAAYLLMCQPVEGLKVVQLNEGQEEVEPFMKRIETDVLPWHPNVVLISHGVNDGNAGKEAAGYTHYHPLYLGMTIDKLQRSGARTILVGSANCVDSTLFGGGPADGLAHNKNLEDFRDLDRDIAAKAGVPFVDVLTPMLDAMAKAKAAYGDKYVFGGADGRYPDRNAQLVMAYAFLKALGCDGNIGTITVDLTANTATGTPGQKIVSAKDGVVQVESTRYPYCFQGDPKVSDATSGIVSCFPFNEDLNRYQLVVTGLTGTKAKVTWGAESREFSAADLEKGVNLAAEFAAHTPFDGKFNGIEDQIWQGQLKQWVYTDTLLHNFEDFKQMAPGAPFDKLLIAIHAQNDKNTAAIAALPTPIQHTLKIENVP